MKRLKILHLLIGILLFSSTSVKSDEFDDDDGVTIENETPDIAQEESSSDAVDYKSPYADPTKFYFADHFDDPDKFNTKWVKSAAKKDDIAEEIAKYDGVFTVEAPQRTILKHDYGLVLKTKAKHAAIASRLSKPFVFSDKPFIVQYEVTMQEGQDCGGSYIKLLSSGPETTDLSQFRDKTPYTIMFGPDKCGNDIKLHFIFRHVNPVNGTITEKHCRKPKDRLEEPFKDKQPHLYTLIIRPDNTYTVKFDHNVVNDGSLFTEFSPPVNPPREIDDPNDKKPENWDEREKIPDPDSRKPDDWDEDSPPQIPDSSVSKPEGWLDDVEEMIPDPSAEKPEDWDIEMDGEWEAPLIANPICEKAVGCGLWKAPLVPNPNYRGKWRAPLIDNPNYQGKWAPRKIPNPDYFEDLHPFKMTTISAVGIELWSMSSDILFDNMIITDDESAAFDWAQQTFDLKRRVIDKQAETFVSKITKYTNENPWIWAAIIVVVGLPLSIVLYLACSSPKAKVSDSAGKSKKTDEYEADDDQIVAEEEAVKAKGKSGLNEPAPEDQEEVEVKDDSNEEEEVEEDVQEEDVEADDDQEEPEGAVIEEIVDDAPESTTQETATRKRKPRRE